MRISFHYSLPSPQDVKVDRPDSFSTPAKAKTLYGSRQTAESGTEYLNSHAHRIHCLKPSHRPLSGSKPVVRRDKLLSAPSTMQGKVTFTYLLDLSCNNIQSEIEELKIVLSELAYQEDLLEEEKKTNRQHYEQLLGTLDKECQVMAKKAAELKSAIVEVQIDITATGE